MNSRKLFILQSFLLVVVIAGIGGGLYFGTTQLRKENVVLTGIKTQASELESVQQSLSNAKKDVEKYSSIEQIAKSVVPQEKDQARTVREIIKLASESNVSIANVSFPSSTLGGSSKSSAKSKSTSSGTTQTEKVDGISNVERLQITITSDTNKPVLFTDFIRFLEKLEQNRRTSQVSGISIQPQDGGNKLDFSLIINVYIKK